jgi:uncharacterized heparinase superfamily protein
MKADPLALLDIARRAGYRRLKARAARLIRYRWVYPKRAGRLFPAVPPDALRVAPDDLAAVRGIFEGMPWDAPAAERATRLLAGWMGVLNHSPVRFDRSFDWSSLPETDPLWVYTIHYGEWALDLASAWRETGEHRYLEVLIRLVGGWIDGNPAGSQPGWEPYPLSRRIVNWSKVHLLMAGDRAWDAFWREHLAPSLHRQARVLAGNLEADLGNNHLVANLRALACVGLLFPAWPGAAAWKEKGLEGLWREMRRQVPPDGVHFERSVSYHSQVLADLLETRRLCGLTGIMVPDDVDPTLDRMALFLADFRAPDGSLPMFNDAVPGYPDMTGLFPDTTGLPRRAKGAEVRPDAGLVRIADGADGCCFFDAGEMGPRHLPGHGHADALSIILWGRKRALVVDPGVFSYHDREWRDRFRGTAAHSTVGVDGLDQCDFFGPFRVAFPPRVRLLGWSDNYAEGEHDGYARFGVTHRRRVSLEAPGRWEVADRFEGRGRHAYALALPLSPGAAVETAADSFTARWEEGVSLRVSFPEMPPGAVLSVEGGWHSAGWNIREAIHRPVLRWEETGPTACRTILVVGG